MMHAHEAHYGGRISLNAHEAHYGERISLKWEENGDQPQAGAPCASRFWCRTSGILELLNRNLVL